MDRHIDLLGVLYLVWGVLGILLGVSVLLLAGGAIAIVASALRRGPDIAAAVTAFGLSASAIILIVGGGAHIWAGTGLRHFRSIARITALGLAVLNLFVLPFGTALGVYGFWVLLHPEARTRFEPPRAAST